MMPRESSRVGSGRRTLMSLYFMGLMKIDTKDQVDLSRGGTFFGLLWMPKQSPPSLQRPGGLFLQADDVRF